MRKKRKNIRMKKWKEPIPTITLIMSSLPVGIKPRKLKLNWSVQNLPTFTWYGPVQTFYFSQYAGKSLNELISCLKGRCHMLRSGHGKKSDPVDVQDILFFMRKKLGLEQSLNVKWV